MNTTNQATKQPTKQPTKPTLTDNCGDAGGVILL